MSLFSRVGLGLTLVLAVTALGAASSGASSSSVSAARSCGHFRQGGVYVNKLRAKGTGCRTARRVARAFNKCRHRHGPRGHCHHRVRRFKCKENRGQSIPVQYNSSVRCRRGGKVIKFVYTQNT
jgi:hypothetical protein